MQVTNYKPFPKESVLKGTFDLIIPKWGGTMRRMKYFQSGSKSWINMPDQEYEQDGKKKYFQYWRFDTDSMKEQFDAKVIELVRTEIAKMAQPVPIADDSVFGDSGLPF